MLLFEQFWSGVAGYRTRPYFFGSDKVWQSVIQSGNSIESYRVDDLLLLQKDTFLKTIFSDSAGLKT